MGSRLQDAQDIVIHALRWCNACVAHILLRTEKSFVLMGVIAADTTSASTHRAAFAVTDPLGHVPPALRTELVCVGSTILVGKRAGNSNQSRWRRQSASRNGGPMRTKQL